ncbi:MAG: NADH-quinone oxidoreductase subunit D [Pirellulales bacterium]|nr:NADH-quinone oxidoreductase subunit D [Pirellulales bacterium]|tara:strand:- start:287 stop:1522 length:1236 start_codon:yes stop_codon:yes gene_type:complete
MSTKVDDPRVIEFDVRTDEMLINMGPQHPSTHGVLRLILRTDGEIVSEVEPHLGYLHRCAEKIGENLTPRQWVPYTDRMDYLAGMNMNLGWALVVEKLLEHDLPEKARHLRVIISEMGRIASHLVGMGAYGLDLGTFSPFLYAFREREKILDLFEKACGARLTYSYLTPGGATGDLPPGWVDECRDFLAQFKPCIPEFHELLTNNQIFIGRTAGIGVMSAATAINYGCTGPVLRGSGVPYDLRFNGEERYTEMYEGYQFDVIVQDPETGKYPDPHLEEFGDDLDYPEIPKEAILGDCWHRFYVRMLEVVQAIRLVEQALDKYESASGDWGQPIKLTQKLPKGEAYLETEAPRGQMGFYLVSTGDSIPWRVRARSSCFCNLSVTSELCRGTLLADVPAIVGSLDVVMGEIDR